MNVFWGGFSAWVWGEGSGKSNEIASVFYFEALKLPGAQNKNRLPRFLGQGGSRARQHRFGQWTNSPSRIPEQGENNYTVICMSTYIYIYIYIYMYMTI